MERASRSLAFHRLDEESKRSPVPEVHSTVSPEDDPNMPVCTMRLLVLGPIVCVLQAYLQSMAMIKNKAFTLNMVLVQFGILIAGRMWEEFIPDKVVRLPWTSLRIPINPPPFNHKEHVLLQVAGDIGRMCPHLMQTIILARGHFNKEVYLHATLMSVFSSTLISFLFVGLFKNWVTSPEMWWPAKLVDVVFFRTWHEKSVGPSGVISSRKFFYIFFGVSCAYQLLPGYLFPSMSCVSFLCWVWNKSSRTDLTAQQIGGGRNGLGLFSFSFDWPSISDFGSDPLSTPPFVIKHVMGGVFLSLFIITPVIYWTDAFDTQNFPLFTTEIYDDFGNTYDISKVLNADGLTFNETAYKAYSIAHFSAFKIGSIALLYVAITSSLVHVTFNYGRAIWKQINEDVHNQRMRSYESVPRRWFYIILVLVILLTIGTHFTKFGPEIQFPYFGILISCVVVLILLPPMGIFAATCNLVLPVNVVFITLGGFLYPSQLFEFMIFTNSSYQIAVNTVAFLGFMKLGHYLKVPPKTMFAVQLVASLIGALVSVAVVWCHSDTLKINCSTPVGSPGSCPSLAMYDTTTTIWAILGSHRIISDGNYKGFILSVICVFTVAEFILSLLSKKWTFLKTIKLPIILAATSVFPAAIPANINSWFLVGISFPYILYHFLKYTSPKHQYLLSLSFTTGAALTNLLGTLAQVIMTFFQFHNAELEGSEAKDTCPLARCPTAPGMVVDGCPSI